MKEFDRLVQVMARLRSPGGCPWDRRQTHMSLVRYLFEEARELKRSIGKKDYHNMEEELGDVLLQILFHARLAEERGRFTVKDVIRTLTRKLTLRHPHVFGYTRAHHRLLKGKKLHTSRDILVNWKTLRKISAR